MSRASPAILLPGALALLAGCKSVEPPKVPGVTPYRMVIQQGNFVSDEMVAQLKPGMTREQVRYVLGTPLVTDIFHADRWDYIFYRELPNGKREQRNLTVVFEGGKLARVIGDLLPAPGTAPKPAAQAKPAAETPKPAPPQPEEKAAGEQKKPEEAKEERGFFGRLIDRITPGTPAEAKPAAEPAAPAAEPKPQEEAPKPEAAAEAKPEEGKPAEENKERGFFGRMLEKIGL